MNEEELKALWHTAEKNAPSIDFAQVEKLSNNWQKRVRRKVKIDISVQISVTVAAVLACIIYPRLILFNLVMIPVCIWYVRELRGLYQVPGADGLPVREFLDLKIKTFERFFRRTRFVVYVINPISIHLFIFGSGNYQSLPNDSDYIPLLIKSIIFITIFYEIAVLIANELYLKFIYQPAFTELRKLREQL